MNEQMIVAIAVRRGRTLDQPDLADQATAQLAWEAWTPIEGLVELPREAEELIDAAGAELGHLTASGQRWHAWQVRGGGRLGARPAPPPTLRPVPPGRTDTAASAPGAGRTVAATPSRVTRHQAATRKQPIWKRGRG